MSPKGVGEAAELPWVVMLTSAENRPLPDDGPLGAGYRESGLPAPSVHPPVQDRHD
ncbi:hypothetical protein V5F49_21375 [Xanthobacter sp. V3C-3]|uniref:hypothetical protein n=1 Tax=Xanthobacter lutulentifluminis TaxID=3119935 RepID=UPI00372A348F